MTLQFDIIEVVSRALSTKTGLSIVATFSAPKSGSVLGRLLIERDGIL